MNAETLKMSNCDRQILEQNKQKKAYYVSNADLYADILSLAYILYMRLEVPEHFEKTPAFTSIPQMINEIVGRRRVAFAEMIVPKAERVRLLQAELRALFDKEVEQYEFDQEEKNLAWLLLNAYSVKDCAKATKKSISGIRYSLRRCCEKSECETKEELVKKLRSQLEAE